MALSCRVDGKLIEVRTEQRSPRGVLLVDSRVADAKPFSTWCGGHIAWTAVLAASDGTRSTLDVLRSADSFNDWYYVFVDGRLRFDQSPNGSDLPVLPEFEKIDEVPVLKEASTGLLRFAAVILAIPILPVGMLGAMRAWEGKLVFGALFEDLISHLGFGAVAVALFAPLQVAGGIFHRRRLRQWKCAREGKLRAMGAERPID